MELATEKRCCQWMSNNRGKNVIFFSLNMESLSLPLPLPLSLLTTACVSDSVHCTVCVQCASLLSLSLTLSHSLRGRRRSRGASQTPISRQYRVSVGMHIALSDIAVTIHFRYIAQA